MQNDTTTKLVALADFVEKEGSRLNIFIDLIVTTRGLRFDLIKKPLKYTHIMSWEAFDTIKPDALKELAKSFILKFMKQYAKENV